MIECPPDKPVLVYEKTVTATDISEETTINARIVHLYPSMVIRLREFLTEATHSCHLQQDHQESFDSQVCGKWTSLNTDEGFNCYRILLLHLDLTLLMKSPLAAIKLLTYCLRR